MILEEVQRHWKPAWSKTQPKLYSAWVISMIVATLMLGTTNPAQAQQVEGSSQGVEINIFPDEFFNGQPNQDAESIQKSLQAQGSLFGAYRELYGENDLNAAQIFMSASNQVEATVNPRILLTLYELRYQVLSSRELQGQVIATFWPEYNSGDALLGSQIVGLTYKLQEYFGENNLINPIKLQDGTLISLPKGINNASVAILRMLGEIYGERQWRELAGNSPNSFKATYERLFPDVPQSLDPSAGPGRFLNHPRKNHNTGITAHFDHLVGVNNGTLNYKGQPYSYEGHNATDYAANYQTLYPADAGKVDGVIVNWGDKPSWCHASWNKPERGVIILHSNNYRTTYWHLSEIHVSLGQQINVGQAVGKSGNTGCTTGPHTHFGVQNPSRVATDPYGYCTNSRRDPAPVTNYWLWADANSPCTQQNANDAPPPPPSYTVGQGSSRPQKFVEAYNRAGGQANFGSPSNVAAWWSNLVRQNFTGNNAIIHDERWENDNRVAAGTCAAYYFRSGILNYYQTGNNRTIFGSPTSDEFFIGNAAKQSFVNGYVGFNPPTYTPWPTSGSGWRREFYNNEIIGCGPSWVDYGDNLSFNNDWGTGRPRPAVFEDRFSARYIRTENFTGGAYTINLNADDGVDVYIDNALLINRWGNLGQFTWTGNISAGQHVITIAYHEYSGPAYLSFSIDPYTPGVTPPSSPSGLNAAAINNNLINLAWTDTSNNEQGFKIERKDGSGGQWGEIASVGAGSQSYGDGGIVPGRTFYYRVRAFNAAGFSGYSNEAQAVTGNSSLVVTVDNSDPGFSISGNPAGIKNGTGCLSVNNTFRYTLNATNSSGTDHNSAIWRPNLPQAGRYKLQALITNCHATSTNVTYEVHTSTGTITKPMNQNAVNGWQYIGGPNQEFYFDAGTNGYVYLGDVTGETWYSRDITMDAIRWVYVGPLTTSEGEKPKE